MTRDDRPAAEIGPSGATSPHTPDIAAGRTSLGIELGSTRIKACLIGPDASTVLASGSHAWENRLEDGHWTYSLDEVIQGLRAAYAALIQDVEQHHGVRPSTFGAIGVSAMMHGYLAFDDAGALLTPFRTWRDTTTGVAAAELSDLFGLNIPLRWSIAHLHQAVLDQEQHIPQVAFITTLAGYVHWQLTGEKVLGVGDASGMFPIASATGDYDACMLTRYDERAEGRLPAPIRDLLPVVLSAGADAGRLTETGAALLDPSGTLRPGVALCPAEGDAGTGMVATNAVAPRTGNISAGTSIFAMVVLEAELGSTHHEIDLVTTPAGDPVAMVHCNNGASELQAWAQLFGRFAEAAGAPVSPDTVFETLFGEALAGQADAGGWVAFNYLAGEPITGLDSGRPLVVRTPDSRASLADFMRAQIYGMFGTLAVGMRVLAGEGVSVDRLFAHGGIFRTAGVAQRLLAAAMNAPVGVGGVAAEGGAWGAAVLASYLRHRDRLSLEDYLAREVFAGSAPLEVEPDPVDVAGFGAYLERFRALIPTQIAAGRAI